MFSHDVRRNVVRTSVPVLVASGALLMPLAGLAQEGANLGRTENFSLYVQPQGVNAEGYFPTGFVHALPSRSAPLGFNLQQGLSSATAGFANGAALETPGRHGEPNNLRYNMRNLSMARPAEALGGLLKRAATDNKLPLKTKAYGEIPTAKLPNGESRFKVAPSDVLNIFHPATRQYLLDYVREHVKARTAPESPYNHTIALWGLDNEWEGQLDYSPEARAAFALWLEKAYDGKVAGLNAGWGTEFKSFSDAANSQLPTSEEYKTKPAAFLDFITFQSEAFVTLIADMARVMHETDPLKRGVIHKSTQQTIEMPVVNRRKIFDHDVLAEKIRPYSGGYIGSDVYGAGDREAYEVNYLFNCIRPVNGPGNYGVFLGEANNHSGPGHQFASTYWRILGIGLKGINFFTMGFAGAEHDWSSFGFSEAATGQPKAKLYYAARWANQIHRTEKFWTQSKPADLPRVAMLMPRRDVLLADKDPKGSQWAYPRNHRWMVYRWLREQGYWVDVIPYSKVNAEFLKGYQGLLLVGAEHLSAAETQTISNYVRDGGVLLADTRAGLWDEHHRVTNALTPLLGVQFSREARTGEFKLAYGGSVLTGQSQFSVTPRGATVLSKDVGAGPIAFQHKSGKGAVVYVPFELGTLSSDLVETGTAAVPKDGPTADVEEYAATMREFLPGRWLGDLLTSAGLRPGYRVQAPAVAGKLRVEIPHVDAAGNCAVVVSNRAQGEQEVLAPTAVEMALPPGPWSTALWTSAENSDVTPVKLEQKGTLHRVSLPEVRTAGVLYLLRQAPPQVGITPLQGYDLANDGATPRVPAGIRLRVKARVFNTTGKPMPAGELRLLVPEGWTASKAQAATPVLQPGHRNEQEFEITAPADVNVKPNWIYPLTVQWGSGGTVAGVSTSYVEVAADLAKMLHVLTENATYPETYPFLTKTGVKYRYLPSGKEVPATGALLNGFSTSHIGQRYSNSGASKFFNVFQTTRADVVFDLQGPRSVRKVFVTPGPGKVRPQQVEVMTSTDGTNFQSQMKAPWNPDYPELETPLLEAQARYVRVQVTWPEAGGTLDEVEIWGR